MRVRGAVWSLKPHCLTFAIHLRPLECSRVWAAVLLSSGVHVFSVSVLKCVSAWLYKHVLCLRHTVLVIIVMHVCFTCVQLVARGVACVWMCACVSWMAGTWCEYHKCLFPGGSCEKYFIVCRLYFWFALHVAVCVNKPTRSDFNKWLLGNCWS